jgi:hypothetical protein
MPHQCQRSHIRSQFAKQPTMFGTLWLDPITCPAPLSGSHSHCCYAVKLLCSHPRGPSQLVVSCWGFQLFWLQGSQGWAGELSLWLLNMLRAALAGYPIVLMQLVLPTAPESAFPPKSPISRPRVSLLFLIIVFQFLHHHNCNLFTSSSSFDSSQLSFSRHQHYFTTNTNTSHKWLLKQHKRRAPARPPRMPLIKVIHPDCVEFLLALCYHLSRLLLTHTTIQI